MKNELLTKAEERRNAIKKWFILESHHAGFLARLNHYTELKLVEYILNTFNKWEEETKDADADAEANA